jgi:hypothetical protein
MMKNTTSQCVGKFQSVHTGSNPVLTTMSKRYSESLVQDLNNGLAECLRREWDILGTKAGSRASQ